MRGRIESGQLVTLAPAAPSAVGVDDVVVEWKGNFLLHLVKEVQADQLLIGNNLGKVNGWVPASAVIGKVIDIGDVGENEGDQVGVLLVTDSVNSHFSLDSRGGWPAKAECC